MGRWVQWRVLGELSSHGRFALVEHRLRPEVQAADGR